MDNRKFIKAGLLASAASVMMSVNAYAGETEDALIAKVVDAYGGDSLTEMRSIRIQNNYKNSFPGQGYTPGYVEFTPLIQDAQIDVANERGSVEGWSANWNFNFNTRTVSVDDDIVAINYSAGTYQPAAAPDYYTAFGPVIRVSDTLLAYELAKRPETAEYQGATTYVGQPHELISFEIPNSPPLTLYVNSETGYISKMARATGFGDLTYQFGNHTSANGVGYAADFEFFVGPDINIISMSRTASVNSVRSTAFRIDRGIEAEPERIDGSEMSVNELADGVHFAGQTPAGGAGAYTVFVDAGDHVIAVGGYGGLQARYDAYKEAAGHDKPLRYQIVTHHHTDHLGGMADANAMGATFVTPANAVGNLNTAAGEDIPEDRLQVLDEKMTLGPVEIYDISTNHMASMALVYIPSIKAVFQADHYNGTYAGDVVSPGGSGTVALKKAIAALDLDVDTVLSAHGSKIIPWSEFEAAATNYDPDPCPGGRAICR